jgi:N-acetylglucosamine kinase-like BadF-type ATPase
MSQDGIVEFASAASRVPQLNDELVLGIDGGGSKTIAALVDRGGRIVHLTRTGGTNPLDNPAWRADLNAVIQPVAANARLRAGVAALPVYGEVEAISAAQTEAVAAALGGRAQNVLNDVDAAQIGAFAGHPGILILSGTGSMAWARDAEGRSHRVGGWGDVVGDEGSAHWIGHRILGLVSQSVDGRAAPTAMVDAVFAQLGLDRASPADALEGWVSKLTHPRAQIAALAPLATQLADVGDAGARSIVDAAASELARHVRAIEPRVGAGTPWSYAGGTLSSRFLLAAVAEQIGRPPVPPRLPPIGGALLAAAKLAEWPTDDDWIERLRRSLADLSAGQKSDNE